MPTLCFTEGITAEIYVHNELNEETSLHWHGLFFYPISTMGTQSHTNADKTTYDAFIQVPNYSARHTLVS